MEEFVRVRGSNDGLRERSNGNWCAKKEDFWGVEEKKCARPPSGFVWRRPQSSSRATSSFSQEDPSGQGRRCPSRTTEALQPSTVRRN
ncbi:Protein of unknown function [Gryllus bimaculatus]|nr:Protein of unknown function [Gryllus bimaculatus]